MKRALLILVLLSFSIDGFGQENPFFNQAKEDLKKLSNDFQLFEKEFSIQDSIFKSLFNNITSNSKESDFDKLKEKQQNRKLVSDKLDNTYTMAQTHFAYFESKGLKKETLLEYFNHQREINKNKDTAENQPQKTYLYFGKNKVIAESDGFFKDKTANLIFNEILATKSEAYLGDFIIPQKNQLISLFKEICSKKIKKDSSTTKKDSSKIKEDTLKIKKDSSIIIKDTIVETNIKVKFKEIKIHLYEGSLYDIKLTVLDENNNELLFENTVPVSLLRYSSIASKNYIFFKTASSNNKNKVLNIDSYVNARIRLSDAFVYIPNPGDNYVPENLTLEFPTKTDGVPDNENNSIKYKVNQDTSLQNIVELRTYTDFLGLFGDAPNGIVQLEGKAEFYILPFNLTNYNVYFFKKISPFVNFSKIEKDVRNLNLTTVNDSTATVKDPLEIIEKSYLKMGLNLNLLNTKFNKAFPFEFNLYTTAKYQISDLIDKDSLQVNYKSFGLGAGLSLDFKRYNNFGFIYSAEFTNYNANSFNEIEGILNPDHFWVFSNEAEVYYFPSETKQQAIFLRLKTFNNSTKNNSEAFYQLQFGYRFAIGVSKLKQ